MAAEPIRSRAWAWYLAAVVFVGQYYVVSSFGATSNETLASALSWSALAVALVGLAVHGRDGWSFRGLIIVGIALYLAGDVVLAGLEADNVIVPFPSLADWLYLAVYPVLIVAIGLIARRTGMSLRPAVAGVAAAVATTLVLWRWYGSDLWSSPFFDETQRRVAVAYPLADAMLLGAAVALLAARRSAPSLLLVGSAVAVVIGNAVYNVDALGAGHEPGGIASIGWITFTALLAGVGLHPTPTERAPEPQDEVTAATVDDRSAEAPTVSPELDVEQRQPVGV